MKKMTNLDRLFWGGLGAYVVCSVFVLLGAAGVNENSDRGVVYTMPRWSGGSVERATTLTLPVAIRDTGGTRHFVFQADGTESVFIFDAAATFAYGTFPTAPAASQTLLSSVVTDWAGGPTALLLADDTGATGTYGASWVNLGSDANGVSGIRFKSEDELASESMKFASNTYTFSGSILGVGNVIATTQIRAYNGFTIGNYSAPTDTFLFYDNLTAEAADPGAGDALLYSLIDGGFSSNSLVGQLQTRPDGSATTFVIGTPDAGFFYYGPGTIHKRSPTADEVLFLVSTSDDASRFSIDEDGDVGFDGDLTVGSIYTLDKATGNRDLTSGTEVFNPVISTVAGNDASFAWSNEAILIINSADHVDVDLPDASANDGKTVWVKRWGAGLVDIEPAGADTIDGTTVSLAAQYDGMRLVASDTLNAWVILSETDGP